MSDTDKNPFQAAVELVAATTLFDADGATKHLFRTFTFASPSFKEAIVLALIGELTVHRLRQNPSFPTVQGCRAPSCQIAATRPDPVSSREASPR